MCFFFRGTKSKKFGRMLPQNIDDSPGNLIFCSPSKKTHTVSEIFIISKILIARR
jgi:hypothetical protein